MKLLSVILLGVAVFATRGSAWSLSLGEINMTKYNTMPPLYAMDDFEKCEPTKGRLANKVPDYCVINVLIDAPKKKSRLVKYMEKFSLNEKQHFNHGIMKRGVCFDKCIAFHESTNDTEKYANDKSPILGADVPSAQGLANAYNKLFNIYINKDLVDNYKLLARTSIEYCVVKNEMKPLDAVDYSFLVAAAFVVLLNLLSIVFEKKKDHQKVVNFRGRFKRTTRLIECFSVRENWRRLVKTESSDKSQNNLDALSCLYASKVFVMLLFVFSQVYRQTASLPLTNPIAIEKSYHSIWMQFFNVGLVTNLFFIICGIELSFKLTRAMQATDKKWDLVKKAVALKYHQHVTLFSAFVWFNSSLLTRLSSSLFWKNHSLLELTACRYNWRLSLLSFINYAKPQEMCMEPTWILSVALHMTAIGGFFLYFLVKFPRLRALTMFLPIALLIGTTITLINIGLAVPVSTTTPEMLRLGVTERFAENYYPTHMNAGNFLIALFVGYLFTVKSDFGRFTSRLGMIVSVVFYSLIQVAIHFYLMNNTLQPPIGSFLGAYMKIHHGIFLTVLIIKLLTWTEKYLKGVERLLKVADKCFTSGFLCSILLVKLFTSTNSKLLEFNLICMFAVAVGVLILSYVCAIFLSVTLEIPFMRLKVGDDVETIPAEESKKKSETEKKID